MNFKNIAAFLVATLFFGSTTTQATASKAKLFGCGAAALGAIATASVWNAYAKQCKIAGKPKRFKDFFNFGWAFYKDAHTLNKQKSTIHRAVLGAEALAVIAAGYLLNGNAPQSKSSGVPAQGNSQASNTLVEFKSFKFVSSNLLKNSPYIKFCSDSLLRIPFATREAKFLAFMKTEQPDIICLQEVDEQWVKALKPLLKDGYILLSNFNTELAIMYKSKAFKAVGSFDFNAPAKIMSQKFQCNDNGTLKEFYVLNIHAPWGQGGINSSYAALYQACVTKAQKENCPILAMGDWNTDGDQKKNRNKEILEGIFVNTGTGFADLSAGVRFTARGVNEMDQQQKIDYLVAQGFNPIVPTRVEPPVFDHLLVHALGKKTEKETTFNPQDPANHWSDHAALITEVAFA